MELKDIIAFTGIEAETMEDFKAKFSESFVPKSQVPDLEKEKSIWVGKTLGPIQTRIKSTFGISADEEKELKTWEDYVYLADKKVKAKESELTELSLKSSDGALKELNEKLEKSNKLIGDYKTANEQAQQTMAQKEQEYKEREKALKTKYTVKEALFDVKDKLASLSESETFHFNSLLKENISIEFDEKDEAYAVNKEGKRWTDPNKAGAFLSPKDAILAIAAEKNFIKKNDAGERKPIFGNNNNAGSGQQQNTEKQIHPSALKR